MSSISRFIKIISISVLFMLPSSCIKEIMVERDFPRFKSVSVEKITINEITFGADIFYNGRDEILDHGFYWNSQGSHNTTDAIKVSLGKRNSDGKFTATVANEINSGNMRYFFAYVETVDYKVYSSIERIFR